MADSLFLERFIPQYCAACILPLEGNIQWHGVVEFVSKGIHPIVINFVNCEVTLGLASLGMAMLMYRYNLT